MNVGEAGLESTMEIGLGGTEGLTLLVTNTCAYAGMNPRAITKASDGSAQTNRNITRPKSSILLNTMQQTRFAHLLGSFIRFPPLQFKSQLPSRSNRVTCYLLREKHRSQFYFLAAVAGGRGGPAVVVTDQGCNPAGKGEPASGVSAPVIASMVNADTLLELAFAT